MIVNVRLLRRLLLEIGEIVDAVLVAPRLDEAEVRVFLRVLVVHLVLEVDLEAVLAILENNYR